MVINSCFLFDFATCKQIYNWTILELQIAVVLNENTNGKIKWYLILFFNYMSRLSFCRTKQMIILQWNLVFFYVIWFDYSISFLKPRLGVEN